jgi:hypothetical protein
MSLDDLNADTEWQAWVASRPPQIQRAIQEFPPASVLHHGGETLYLIGWGEMENSEDVSLLFSIVDPDADYDLALEPQHKRRICASHFRACEEHHHE